MMSVGRSLPSIDIERIKAYNSNLKAYMEKVAKLKAEQEFTSNELLKTCAELSNELGIPVTPDNIEQVYVERVAKIEDTLRIGEEILARIKAEENNQEYNKNEGAGIYAGMHSSLNINNNESAGFSGFAQLPQMFGLK